jgi:hypothetical protein
LVAELAERGLTVDYRSVWEFVHAEKLSFKKSVVAGERDRPNVARRRALDQISRSRHRPDLKHSVAKMTAKPTASALPQRRAEQKKTNVVKIQ